MERQTACDNGRSMLVTGGAGFIGSHLAEALLEQGYHVRVLDDFSTGKMENLESLGEGRFRPGRDFELVRGDIRELPTVMKAMEGVLGVFHLAALGSVPRSVEDPVTTQQVNADGTLNVFLAARDRGLFRVVYASSSAVYGDSEILPRTEGTEGNTLSPYALTKRVNEEYGRLFSDLYGFQTIGLRYFNVYGPRQDPNSQYAAVIPRFVTALLSGKPPTIYGTGLQTRDFTFVKDVVQANLCAMSAPDHASGKVYNIGRGDRTNLLELAAVLRELLKVDLIPRHADLRPGDVMHSSADTGRASEVLGFAPAFDLKQGLEQSIEWYRKNL